MLVYYRVGVTTGLDIHSILRAFHPLPAPCLIDGRDRDLLHVVRPKSC